MTIEPMCPSDVDAVHTLLRANKLPTAGLEVHLATALVAREGDRVLGSAALEVYGPFGLLRSLAVDAARRDQGLGQLMVTEALALARRLGLKEIYLLTETAARFFPKLGFVPIARTQVPPEVQQSIEFTTLCPASAQAMVHRPRADN